MGTFTTHFWMYDEPEKEGRFSSSVLTALFGLLFGKLKI